MTLVSRSVEMLLDRDPEAARTQLDPAARAPARGARRDARADLRAAARQPRAGRADPRAQDPHRGAPGPDRPAGRRREHARRSACRWRSRRSCTGSPRRRSTTSSSTPARPTGPRRGRPRRRAASGCASRTTARASTRRRVPDGHLGLAGMRARAERIGATLHVSRACRARAPRSRSSCPERRASRRPARTPDRPAARGRRPSATDDVGGPPSFGRGRPRRCVRSAPRAAGPTMGGMHRPPAGTGAAPRPRRRRRRPGPREPGRAAGDRRPARRRRQRRAGRPGARPRAADQPGRRRRRSAPARARRRPRFIARLRAAAPGVRILVMSWSDAPRAAARRRPSATAFVRKTFRPDRAGRRDHRGGRPTRPAETRAEEPSLC